MNFVLIMKWKDTRCCIICWSHTFNKLCRCFVRTCLGDSWLLKSNLRLWKIENNKLMPLIFSNHSILSWSLFTLVQCFRFRPPVKWNDPYTSNDFSTLKRITDKNNNHTYKRICIEKGEIDLSGFWLWMCGEYPRCYPQEVT